MPYVITKRSQTLYLGFDNQGNHAWYDDILDAVRYNTHCDALQFQVNLVGSKIVEVDEWNGHYSGFHGYEVQIYHDKIQKTGGKRWKFRIGPIINEKRCFEYSPCHHGYSTPENAMKGALDIIQKKLLA